MKKFLDFIVGLWQSMLFRKTLINFGLFFAAIAVFSFLTSNHIITRTPERVVPAEYGVLAHQNKTMPAVDLEQTLRSGAKDIEGLVFFDGIKSVVVLGKGFEKDRIVLQADTDEMRKLAEANAVQIVEKKSALEEGVLLPGWYPFAIVGFVIWFARLMFARRENKEEPSRFRVIVETTPRVLDDIVHATKMKKTKFFTLLICSLVVVNSALFFTRMYHDTNQMTLPPEISTVTRTQPWQATRHLDTHASEFQRVTLVSELNTAYVVLNTATAPVGTKPEDIAAGKTFPVERTIVFAQNAQGKADFNAFTAKLAEKKVEMKTVAPVLNTSYIDTLTPMGRNIMLGFLLLTLITGIVMLHGWQEWRAAEGGNGPTPSNRMAGAGGRAYAVSAEVEVRDEDRKTFEDVAGCQEAIDELRVVEKKIRRPRLYKVFGAPVPSGVLLYGPPGTGKTLLARALSGEIGGHFEAMSGSQFVEMYVGVGAKRVREAYTRARTAARRTGRISIVFIDEIDAIAKKRGSGDGGGDKEYEQTLNELLVQMNGFGNHGLVLTMAATNRLDILDEAILRPGRFDIKVKVPKPDKKGRAQIYGVYLKKLKVVTPAGTPEEKAAAHAKLLDDLARRSHDFSGAEIEGAIKNGATIAVERQFGNVTEDITDEQMEEYKEKAIITIDDLNLGVDKMAYGTQIRSRVRTDKERWATAVHEIGHATIPTVLGGDPVNRITIVMTDKALGLMDSSPEEGERYDWTDKQFEVRLQMMLAGRAAEKVLLGKISTGASNDFERTSQLARQMVGAFGMSKEFGVKSLPLDQHGFPISKVGEILLDKFNVAWGKIVDDAEAACDLIIEKHRVQIEAAARALYDEETLTGDEFRKIWKESAPKPVTEGGAATSTPATSDGAQTPAADAPKGENQEGGDGHTATNGEGN